MNINNKLKLFIGLWTVLLLIWGSMLSAAPQAELIPFFVTGQKTKIVTVDHSAWQTILDGYLDAEHSSRVNRFNYAKLKANAADQKKLNRYLSYLQTHDPRRYPSAEQKAYWINFYNALVVQIVLGAYPVSSITKIHQNLVKLGPWKEKRVEVAGKNLSLDDIEHGILRPIWRDNRIHYGINSASYGGANLAPEAYTATNIEELLEKGARDYVNHPRAVRFLEKDSSVSSRVYTWFQEKFGSKNKSTDDNSLLISSMYDWYKDDFGFTDEDVIKHLIKYAKPKLAKRLESYKGSIEYKYDWHLNEP